MPFLFSCGTLQKEKTQLALFGLRVAMLEITDKTLPASGEEKQQRMLQHFSC